MRKKIIFLEREKNNFNSTFKLKSVSIFITNDFLWKCCKNIMNVVFRNEWRKIDLSFIK